MKGMKNITNSKTSNHIQCVIINVNRKEELLEKKSKKIKKNAKKDKIKNFNKDLTNSKSDKKNRDSSALKLFI